MLSGINILCFAASYAITLALEITRLFFRSGVRGAIMLAFAGAGLLAHTVFLCNEALQSVGHPLSREKDWYLVAAWVLAAIYLYLTAFHPKNAFGVFILPLVLGLIGVGTFLADPKPFARGPASQWWGAIHGASLLLATVAVMVGFAAGLMYLRQASRLKLKLPPQQGMRLPSLEWLRRANGRAMGIAMLAFGAGILSGMVLNLINYGPRTERVPWDDPVVLGTAAMLGWLVFSAVLGIICRPAREGRKVAFRTILTFLLLVVALGVLLFADTQHGGSQPPGDEASELENDSVGSLPAAGCRPPIGHRALWAAHRPSFRWRRSA
ncbi:MAG: cytochrome c biogenesis protein CcsA [Planctomycetota bacterium]|jgi:ABC-type uncharacterized transport system permease subunit